MDHELQYGDDDAPGTPMDQRPARDRRLEARGWSNHGWLRVHGHRGHTTSWLDTRPLLSRWEYCEILASSMIPHCCGPQLLLWWARELKTDLINKVWPCFYPLIEGGRGRVLCHCSNYRIVMLQNCCQCLTQSVMAEILHILDWE